MRGCNMKPRLYRMSSKIQMWLKLCVRIKIKIYNTWKITTTYALVHPHIWPFLFLSLANHQLTLEQTTCFWYSHRTMGYGTWEELSTLIDSEKLLNHRGVHHPCLHPTYHPRTFRKQLTDSYTRAHGWPTLRVFQHEEGRTLLLETFLFPTYLNTIQTSCAWILRYLTAAAILPP